MWQTKYAAAVPKNLGLGLDFRPCSEDGLRTPSGEKAITALHGWKLNPNPKFLGTAEAYYVCHIGLIFQISLIYAFTGCPIVPWCRVWPCTYWAPSILLRSRHYGVSVVRAGELLAGVHGPFYAQSARNQRVWLRLHSSWMTFFLYGLFTFLYMGIFG